MRGDRTRLKRKLPTNYSLINSIHTHTHTHIYIYILLYLVLNTFCTWSLAAIYGVFFFWPIDCVSVDFFQLLWQGWSLLFFPDIYIFSLGSDSLHIFIFELFGFFSPYRKCYYSISYLIYIYDYIYVCARTHARACVCKTVFGIK